MLKLAVFGSGAGSNFGAILAAVARGDLTQTEIRLVLSNNSRAGILDRARAHGIPAVHCSRAQWADDSGFEGAMLEHLRSHGADFIALAGYMKRLAPRVLAAFPDRVLNIHPALLPKHGGEGMYGLRVHEAVLAAGEKESGATVHLVDEEYDRGPIVLQRKVPVLAGDTPEALAARVLNVEHAIYPEAIGLFAGGRVRVLGRRVVIH